MEASKERYGLNENLLMFSPVIKKSECWEKIRQEQIRKDFFDLSINYIINKLREN